MIPVIDIFAGPGGLGEGFSAYRDGDRQVFKIALSIEKEPLAHSTLELRSFFRQFSRADVPQDYYLHLQGKLTREELFARHHQAAQRAKHEAWQAELGKTPKKDVDLRIKEALSGARNWLLIGGPPCQAYSLAGRVRMRGKDPDKFDRDPRHFLYKEYLRILEDHRPPYFVMENVKGILSAKVRGESIIDRVLEDLRALGYRLHSFVTQPPSNGNPGALASAPDFLIRAEEYGIPQARHRVILLGVRGDLKSKPVPLIPHPKQVSLWKAICDLPRLRSQLSRQVDSGAAWLSVLRKTIETANGTLSSAVKREMRSCSGKLSGSLGVGQEFALGPVTPEFKPRWFGDPRLGGTCNHKSRYHMALDLQRYFFAACFAKEEQRPPLLADFPRSLLPDHKNVEDGVMGEMFRDRFRVQLKERPSTTITSHIAKDGHYFIHPDPTQCRSFTVREAARLQTFPDNYYFVGPRTKQYQQVGNAVPPLLARQLAEVIFNMFTG